MTESTPPPGSWDRQLRDTAGQVVGQIKACLCRDEVDLKRCIGFSEAYGGFTPYAEQISPAVIWPIAALLELEVCKEFRDRGFGSAALNQFLADARTAAAGTAFLRVGWWDYGGDDPYAVRDRNILWYSRRGFRELKSPSPKILIPYMYRFL